MTIYIGEKTYTSKIIVIYMNMNMFFTYQALKDQIIYKTLVYILTQNERGS